MREDSAAKRSSPIRSARAKRSRRDVWRASRTSAGFTSARGRGRTSFGAVSLIGQKTGLMGRRYYHAPLGTRVGSPFSSFPSALTSEPSGRADVVENLGRAPAAGPRARESASDFPPPPRGSRPHPLHTAPGLPQRVHPAHNPGILTEAEAPSMEERCFSRSHRPRFRRHEPRRRRGAPRRALRDAPRSGQPHVEGERRDFLRRRKGRAPRSIRRRTRRRPRPLHLLRNPRARIRRAQKGVETRGRYGFERLHLPARPHRAHTHLLLQGDATSAEYDEQVLLEDRGPIGRCAPPSRRQSRSTTASRPCVTSGPRARDSRTWISSARSNAGSSRGRASSRRVPR